MSVEVVSQNVGSPEKAHSSPRSVFVAARFLKRRLFWMPAQLVPGSTGGRHPVFFLSTSQLVRYCLGHDLVTFAVQPR